MSQKIPRGDENLICRWHKLPMSEVCHRCDAWCHLQGRNPNTGEMIDDWKCADSWIPILLLEIATRIRGVSGEIGALRQETTNASAAAASEREGLLTMLATVARPGHRLLGPVTRSD